jgi:glycerophosphoryl diester phosphodiesterase
MSKIVAHRGLSAAYPENTMLAFRRAVETGCDGIELDVQLTADGELVVIHDETVDRTTGAKAKVRELGLAELRRLDASAVLPGDFGFNPIPTFAEYLEFIADKPQWTNIEIKNSVYPYPGLVRRVAMAVKERGLGDKVLFSSFNHQALLEARSILPRTELAFIESSWLVRGGVYCKAAGVEYLNPRACYLNAENMAELEDNGIRVQAWTVNDAAEMERLLELKAFAIITNDPALGLKVAGR